MDTGSLDAIRDALVGTLFPKPTNEPAFRIEGNKLIITTAGFLINRSTNPMFEFIAEKVHEANRAHCKAHGDYVDPEWAELPEDRQDSTIAAVKAQLENPALTPEESHLRWMEQRLSEGWVYGTVKDPVAKTHPCLVTYAELPAFQREKDTLFTETVNNALAEWNRLN